MLLRRIGDRSGPPRPARQRTRSSHQAKDSEIPGAGRIRLQIAAESLIRIRHAAECYISTPIGAISSSAVFFCSSLSAA